MTVNVQSLLGNSRNRNGPSTSTSRSADSMLAAMPARVKASPSRAHKLAFDRQMPKEPHASPGSASGHGTARYAKKLPISCDRPAASNSLTGLRNEGFGGLVLFTLLCESVQVLRVWVAAESMHAARLRVKPSLPRVDKFSFVEDTSSLAALSTGDHCRLVLGANRLLATAPACASPWHILAPQVHAAFEARRPPSCDGGRPIALSCCLIECRRPGLGRIYTNFLDVPPRVAPKSP